MPRAIELPGGVQVSFDSVPSTRTDPTVPPEAMGRVALFSADGRVIAEGILPETTSPFLNTSVLGTDLTGDVLTTLTYSFGSFDSAPSYRIFSAPLGQVPAATLVAAPADLPTGRGSPQGLGSLPDGTALFSSGTSLVAAEFGLSSGGVPRFDIRWTVQLAGTEGAPAIRAGPTQLDVAAGGGELYVLSAPDPASLFAPVTLTRRDPATGAERGRVEVFEENLAFSNDFGVDMARLADGRVAVVSANLAEVPQPDGSDTFEDRPQIVIFAPDLSVAVPQRRLDAAPTDDADAFGVHALARGGYAVTWQEGRTEGSLNGERIVVETYRADDSLAGRQVFDLGPLIPDGATGQGARDIVVTPSGDLFLYVAEAPVRRLGEVPDTALPLDRRGDDGPDALTGDGRGNRLEGLSGDDLLDGGGGDDVLLGGPGADTLLGGAGDDVLSGGPGPDRMVGGDGSDVYTADAADTVVEAAGAPGVDEMRVAADAAIADGIERIVAVGGRGLRLDGSAGAETLVGNAEADILVGFGGADTMTGGGGADVFVLTAQRGTAPEVTVTDWGRGGDRLAIDDQLLGLGTAGIAIRDLTVDVFRTLRDSGAVGYDARAGILRLDLDGDGTREIVADLGSGVRLGLEDVLLF